MLHGCTVTMAAKPPSTMSYWQPGMYPMQGGQSQTQKSVHLLKIALVVVAVIAVLGLAMVVFLFTNQSITSRIIEDGTVSETDVQDDAITTRKIADGVVTTDKIGAGSVTTAKLSIKVASVTNGKLVASPPMLRQV